MSAYSSVQHVSCGIGSFVAGLILVEGPDGSLRRYWVVGLIGAGLDAPERLARLPAPPGLRVPRHRMPDPMAGSRSTRSRRPRHSEAGEIGAGGGVRRTLGYSSYHLLETGISLDDRSGPGLRRPPRRRTPGKRLEGRRNPRPGLRRWAVGLARGGLRPGPPGRPILPPARRVYGSPIELAGDGGRSAGPRHWCDPAGLEAEAIAHLTAVTRRKPDDAEARRRLAFDGSAAGG